MNHGAALERLRALDRERTHLARAAALLQWDEETCLPPAGVEDRAEQLAVLEGLAHEKLTSPRLGGLLEELEAAEPDGPGPDGLDAGAFPVRDFLRILRRDYDRAVKLPAEYVRETARAGALSQAAWVRARNNNDFAAFAPHLERMIDLARQKALYLGWDPAAVYDGLLDLYEPGVASADLAALFGPLGERLSALLRRIAARPRPDAAFSRRPCGVEKQDALCREVLTALGFDFNRGRLDLSAHPFTTTLGFNDVRITTRYDPEDPLSGLFSVIHEGGHAFYELALDPVLRSSCLAEGTSMGIHESQSRLWENVIGRSRAFWRPWFPRFRDYVSLPEGTAFEDFYRALNAVVPGPIRVEADEVSYSLHIILRFDLERRLFDGTLPAGEVPAAWSAAMKKYLDIEPSGDAEGALQDVHWSMGAFGYFPSYALGNLYGLEFWERLCRENPGTEAALERRDYGGIHRWLGEHIHRWGRRADPAELLGERAAGESGAGVDGGKNSGAGGNNGGNGGASAKPRLRAGPFLRYIETKYTELYEL
ncbi:MAG: carboxypeptidase M32 [Treponema sp.]|jgi:carboxypeptidase Taq|nr:carboxypeptidase M32 [Treponema sp.]